MAAPDDPRDGVVSIWHTAEDAFLGSGAFILPHLVLTAKHVVQDKTPSELHLRLVDGHDRVTPCECHYHDTLDIALIDLGRDFPRQQIARLNSHHSGLEGVAINIYGVNPDTHSRDECRGYTLGAWHNEMRSYLFDHAQRKGFSGGIGVHAGEVIGILTDRHETEQQGVMLPLTEAAAWLQGFLPDWIPPSPVTDAGADLTQHAFTRQVRQEVGLLLERQALHPLRDQLLADVAGSDPHDKPEHVLIPLDDTFSIESSMHTLRQATRACRQRLVDQRAATMQAMLDGALGVFGWLVLLTVSENWVQETLGPQHGASERHFQDLLGAAYIALPVQTETGTEIVESRLREKRAALALDDRGVRSPKRVPLGDLERGIAPDDDLSQIKKLIWARVIKGDDVPEPFELFHEDFLKNTLDIRYRDGESYYVMLPAKSGRVADGQETLLRRLRHDLPHLGAFLIGMETGEQVLVMNETRLLALTHEFLRVLQDE